MSHKNQMRSLIYIYTRATYSCTNLQHELSRMDRQWQAAVKELRHIVEHTPVPEWERSLRNFYVEYVGTFCFAIFSLSASIVRFFAVNNTGSQYSRLLVRRDVLKQAPRTKRRKAVRRRRPIKTRCIWPLKGRGGTWKTQRYVF